MKKWTINPESIDKLYPLLYKKIEIGGKFTFPINKQGIVQKITSINKIHTMNGSSDSVQAPEGIANFHTHPISCYVGENTVWGWPSGEDIRETLLFGMKGSVVHLVLAIEGVYSLQVNPCILSSFMHIESETEKILLEMFKSSKGIDIVKNSIKMLNNHFKIKDLDEETEMFLKSKGIKSNQILTKYLEQVNTDLKHWVKTGIAEEYLVDAISDVLRGLIVLYIEIYFRSSHRFRNHDVNKEILNKMYPVDFLKFVNSFKISNIFNTGKKVKGCGKLQCGGVPVYEGKKGTVSSFSKYVNSYETSTKFYMVSNHGETLSLNTNLNKLNGYSNYIKDIKIGNNCVNKNLGFWEKNWFKMTLAPNKVILPGSNRKPIYYMSKSINSDQRKQFLEFYDKNTPPDPTKGPIFLAKIPTFYFYTIKGECDHIDITKHLLSHKPNNVKSTNVKILVFGSNRCGWCSKTIKKLEKSNIPYTKKYYNSINEAIDKASKYGKIKINSIPAIFVNGNYEGGYSSVKKIIKNSLT